MFPLPHHPQVDARLGKAIIDKILVNYDKLKLRLETSRWQGMRGIIYAFVALAAVIGAIIYLTGMSVTELIGWATGGGGEAAAQAVQNATTPTVPLAPGDNAVIISSIQ